MFIISQEKGTDEVYSLHADKHQIFLLVDITSFNGHHQSYSKHLK